MLMCAGRITVLLVHFERYTLCLHIGRSIELRGHDGLTLKFLNLRTRSVTHVFETYHKREGDHRVALSTSTWGA
jgi:hypothetical protein